MVVVVGAVGVVAPHPARVLDRAGGIEPTLALLVFATGLSVDAASLWAVRARWARLLVVLAVSTVALPGLAWAVSRLVSGPARYGILTLGVAPSEVASVAFVGVAGGETAVAAALLAASGVVTVIDAGPVLGLLVHAPTLHPLGLLANLALVVALPLAAGSALRRIARPGRRGLDLGRLVGTTALLVLLWEVASQVQLRSAYATVAIALCVLLAGSAGLGWLLASQLPKPARPGVLLPVAMRDFAIAAGIADAAFGPAATGPLGLYGLLVLLFGATIVRLGTAR